MAGITIALDVIHKLLKLVKLTLKNMESKVYKNYFIIELNMVIQGYLFNFESRLMVFLIACSELSSAEPTGFV